MMFSTQTLTTLLLGGSLLVAGSCGVHGLDDTDTDTAAVADRNQELVREQLERRLAGVFAAKGT